MNNLRLNHPRILKNMASIALKFVSRMFCTWTMSLFPQKYLESLFCLEKNCKIRITKQIWRTIFFLFIIGCQISKQMKLFFWRPFHHHFKSELHLAIEYWFSIIQQGGIYFCNCSFTNLNMFLILLAIFCLW